MRHFYRRKLAVAVLPLMTTSGCSPTIESFRTAQVCLGNREGRSLFRHELEAIAQSEKMRFNDNSENTTADLKTIGFLHEGDGSVIKIGVDRPDGEGLTANNVGLPASQVAIGFTEGSHPPNGHRFADVVIERLKRHWRVETVDASGVDSPLNDCA